MNQVELFQAQDNAPVPQPANQAINMLEYAISQGAAIETIERIMALQEQTRQREAKAAFDHAISQAKAEMPIILKSNKVDFTGKTGIRTNYQYEDLAQIAKDVDPILAKYGLSYRFRTNDDGDKIIVTCIVSHALGYSEENSLSARADESGNKNSIQAKGSTQTYLQRYTLKAALGLASAKDDDARFKDTGNMETITDDQIKRIRELIDKTNSDTAKFCQVMKVQSVADIAAKDFKSVERRLLLKLEEGGK